MSEKEWTIMVYMAGDNNLAVDMAYAMEQIKEVAGEGENSPNLFVYYDGNSPSIPTLYCDFSVPGEPRYVRSFMVPDKLCDVPNKENENAADRRAILNFVDWCVNKVEVAGPNGEITYGRRAKRYAMIFSGHSLGFQDKGLFRDETSGRSMKMKDLYFTLEDIVSTKDELLTKAKNNNVAKDMIERETKVLLGQKLDLLGFDSCVMGMLEVGYQFNYVAKTMIASEGSVPNAGWTYAKILGNLARKTGAGEDAKAVAERFVRDFIESQDAYTVGGVSVDMAAWDLSQMTDLATSFDGLADILIQCFAEPDHIYRQMERVILQVHWKCQSYMYDQNVDLGDFCELLDREIGLMIEEMAFTDRGILNDVQDRCREVLEKLRSAVILSGFSGGDYQYSNGMSIFFPWSRQAYDVSKKNYESLWFAKDAGNRNLYWSAFLKTYLGKVAIRKLEPLTETVKSGEKYRYQSGIKFAETSVAATASAGADTKLAGERDSKLAGERDSKLAGERDSKLAGERDSKIAGERDSKLAGERDSKLAGEKDSKLAGEKDSKLAGERDSKLAGERDSKLAGERDSKLAGEKDSKLAGEKDSKLAGEKDSKLAGEKDSKLAGEKDSKLAGERDSKLAGEKDSKLAGEKDSKLAGGSSGSSAFFDSLRMFKNIESRWNVSGFTKKPADEDNDQRDSA